MLEIGYQIFTNIEISLSIKPKTKIINLVDLTDHFN
jgi:hypothetical protein